MLYIKVFLEFIFYFIGTFLHEAAHYAAAKLTFCEVPDKAIIEEEDGEGNIVKRKISGFTIVPRINKNQIIYGHVIAIPRLNAAYTLVAIAPLIWIAALFYFLSASNMLFASFEKGYLSIEFNYREFFSFENILTIFISLQLLWAGTLSSQDIKMFFKGVFSLSFFFISTTAYFCYLFFANQIDFYGFFSRISNV